jgi:hypothetical protein
VYEAQRSCRALLSIESLSAACGNAFFDLHGARH